MIFVVWYFFVLLLLFALPRILDRASCPLCGARKKHEKQCPWANE